MLLFLDFIKLICRPNDETISIIKKALICTRQSQSLKGNSCFHDLPSGALPSSAKLSVISDKT